MITAEIYTESGKLPSTYTIMKYFGSWNNAITEAGLQATTATQKIYTADEEYVNSLKSCYELNNGYITASLYADQGFKPTLKSITTRFGSWNNALVFAGIQPTRDGQSRYSKKSIITTLRKFYEEHGFVTKDAYEASDYTPCISTIKSYFGTFRNALEEAEIPSQSAGYTKEQIVAILRECYEENLGSLTSGEYSKLRDKPSAYYIKRKFGGSWHQALKAASLPYKEAYLVQG